MLLRVHAGPSLLDTQRTCVSLGSEDWLGDSFRLVKCGCVSLLSGCIEELKSSRGIHDPFPPVVVEVLADIETLDKSSQNTEPAQGKQLCRVSLTHN